MNSSLRAVWLERIIIWILFAVSVAIAFWSAPRGFDFLDTGCYFLEYKYPDDVADTHTTYRLFARPFYLLAGEDVVTFRYISWIVLWMSAFALAWGWRRYLLVIYPRMEKTIGWWTMTGLFLVVSGAVYTIKPAALTYNSLNFVGVCVALAFFFDGTARTMREQHDPEPRWTGVIEIAVGAFAAAVDLLIKPTTAAFLVAAIGGYCAVTPAFTWQTKKRLGLVALIAAGAALIGMIVMVGGFRAFVVRIGTLTSILDNAAYMNELNTRTVREFREIATFLMNDLKWTAAAIAVSLPVLSILRRNVRWQNWVAVLSGLSTFGLWAFSTYRGGLWSGSHQLYFEGIVARLYLGAVVVTGLMCVVSWLVRPAPAEMDGRRIFWVKILTWGLLVATPFAGAYGSTTTVYLNGALYAVCWMGAILIATHEIVRRWQCPSLLLWITLPVSGFATAQLYHGQIYMPYMNPRPLWEQTVPTEMGRTGSYVLLDPAASEFITKSKAILSEHGFKADDDIFCFFNIPGLVYAVGGRSPIIPWYFGRIYVGNPVEEIHMQAAGEERRRNAWIVTQADVSVFRDHFVRGGIDFPNGYEEIGVLKNPQSGLEVKIWKPKGRAL